ncbi:MAG: hypothetical protein BWY99_02735 [Synergistetes bacterium ADurb.BinA166]|nr:MAG: hypothetical protein BWY99_02735 [Synergistetes bacterium ADurb.BinA166]
MRRRLPVPLVPMERLRTICCQTSFGISLALKSGVLSGSKRCEASGGRRKPGTKVSKASAVFGSGARTNPL